MDFKTEQEKFWAGEFGCDYIERNNSEQTLLCRVAVWARMLRSANGVTSARELGCNIGLNLMAINRLCPDIALSAVEINEKAAKQASSLNIAKIKHDTILKPIKDEVVDLTFTCGVLIHVNPDNLIDVYNNLVQGSKRYVLVYEYYNPTPVSVTYRGHESKLFKRDFAGEIMDQFGLKLVDYGFFYRRDNWTPQDDATWFLLEK
ncbi:MAG: pseudaminic acid biosynthesis-associated methylase [Pseudomonadota bacterium]